MAFTPSNSGLTRNLQRFADLPNKYVILCSPGTAFTGALTMTDVISAESIGTGYLRQAYAPGAATYDATQSRAELNSVSATFSAGATGYSFTAAVLLSRASAVASKAITAIDTSANTLTVAGHGLAIGDKVILTLDPSGVTPGGITPGVIYFVQSVPSADLVTLSATNGGTVIDLTSTGTLPLRLRYANGEVELFESYSATAIAANSSHNLAIQVSTGGATADVNAA